MVDVTVAETNPLLGEADYMLRQLSLKEVEGLSACFDSHHTGWLPWPIPTSWTVADTISIFRSLTKLCPYLRYIGKCNYLLYWTTILCVSHTTFHIWALSMKTSEMPINIKDYGGSETSIILSIVYNWCSAAVACNSIAGLMEQRIFDRLIEFGELQIPCLAKMHERKILGPMRLSHIQFLVVAISDVLILTGIIFCITTLTAVVATWDNIGVTYVPVLLGYLLMWMSSMGNLICLCCVTSVVLCILNLFALISIHKPIHILEKGSNDLVYWHVQLGKLIKATEIEQFLNVSVFGGLINYVLIGIIPKAATSFKHGSGLFSQHSGTAEFVETAVCIMVVSFNLTICGAIFATLYSCNQASRGIVQLISTANLGHATIRESAIVHLLQNVQEFRIYSFPVDERLLLNIRYALVFVIVYMYYYLIASDELLLQFNGGQSQTCT